MHEATVIVHKQIPPCSCDECIKAIEAAIERAAEIVAILRRLDELELHCTTADKLEKEAGE